MDEIFTRDNVLGDNIYRQVLRSDPPTKEELLSANLLRMVNTTTYKGMTAATLKRSTKLKAKLLKNFKDPRREFGGLWCWVVCSHHGPRSGCARDAVGHYKRFHGSQEHILHIQNCWQLRLFRPLWPWYQDFACGWIPITMGFSWIWPSHWGNTQGVGTGNRFHVKLTIHIY